MTAPDFSSRGRRPAVRTWETLLFGGALLLLVFSSYRASASWAELKRAQTALAAETRAANELQERLRKLESGPGSGVGALAARIVASTEAPPPRVLLALSALMPSDVRLDSLSFNYGARLDLEARVVARHAESYDLFLKRLSESSVFEGIVPGSESRQGETRASLRMSYRPGPGR